MTKFDITPKRKKAIAILENWLYEIYNQDQPIHSFEIWQWVKQLKVSSATKLKQNELDSLHTLWDEYVKYTKEKDAR